MPQKIATSAEQLCFADENRPQLVYASTWLYENGRNARPMHRHDHTCELLLTSEGHGLHTVSGHSYHTQRGDLLVYNAGAVHEDCAPESGRERILAIGVDGLHLPGLPAGCLLPRQAESLLRTGSRFAEFETLFRLIYEHTSEPSCHSEEIAAHLMTALLLLVMQLGHETADNARPESTQVNLMRGYIDTHYAEDITLEAIASQAGLSTYYASHLFKDYCGYSPVQYVIRRRIGEAQTLLLVTSLTVTQIAAQTGFDSPNHFSTIFSKHTGYSPSAYRKTFRHPTEEEKSHLAQKN